MRTLLIIAIVLLAPIAIGQSGKQNLEMKDTGHQLVDDGHLSFDSVVKQDCANIAALTKDVQKLVEVLYTQDDQIQSLSRRLQELEAWKWKYDHPIQYTIPEADSPQN
jgi:hypothetical protein